jgi:hypothetical protein
MKRTTGRTHHTIIVNMMRMMLAGHGGPHFSPLHEKGTCRRK